jgi:chemotaxis protein MotB
MAEESKQTEKPAKKKRTEAIGGAPAWMVTYADMVTLLLTFFVLLLSMASLDPVRFTQASSSLKDAFGIHSRPANVEFAIPILPSPPITKFSPIQSEMSIKIYRRIKTQIDANTLSQEVEIINKDADTIILRINESILFEPGETKISPKSYPLLRYLSDIIRPLPLRLRIEGHTDVSAGAEVELESWDTSMARAVSVLRFLKKGDLLPLDRMAAAGYGSQRPIEPNDSPENRAKNRRVEFLLRTNTTVDLEQSNNDSSAIPF